MAVFVLDKRKNPLMPCSEKRARKLLESGRARVHRFMPFSIRLVDRCLEDSALQPIEIKIDPGQQNDGDHVGTDAKTGEVTATAHVLNLFELAHRGRQMRRRRCGNLRYRAPGFLNRGNKGKGWLAPSLQHRIATAASHSVPTDTVIRNGGHQQRLRPLRSRPSTSPA